MSFIRYVDNCACDVPDRKITDYNHDSMNSNSRGALFQQNARQDHFGLPVHPQSEDTLFQQSYTAISRPSAIQYQDTSRSHTIMQDISRGGSDLPPIATDMTHSLSRLEFMAPIQSDRRGRWQRHARSSLASGSPSKASASPHSPSRYSVMSTTPLASPHIAIPPDTSYYQASRQLDLPIITSIASQCCGAPSTTVVDDSMLNFEVNETTRSMSNMTKKDDNPFNQMAVNNG